MTKERLKYLLDSGIMQDAVDGKALQYRTHSGSSWFDVEGFPDFNATVEFRVKPKLNVPKVVRFGDLDNKTKDSYTQWVVIAGNGTARLKFALNHREECEIDDDDSRFVLRNQNEVR